METIDKKALSERDICTKYITPAIVQAAKDNNHGIGDGMQQALVNENGDCVAQNRKYLAALRGLVVREVFEDAYNYMKSGTLMRQVINKINEIDFNISEDRHLLCVTNMLLHGIEVPSQIRHDNTLARPLRDYGSDDRVDVLVTNPPFGGMEEDGIESNFPAAYRTRETADLFHKRRAYKRDMVLGTGSTFPSVSYGQLMELPIPLPPLAEHRRIVARVDQLMSLCDELEAGLARSQADSEKLMEAAVGRMLAD